MSACPRPETSEGDYYREAVEIEDYRNVIFSPSHLPDRLWHIAQRWPPGRRHSGRWQADGCTSSEPHPADERLTVATQRAEIHTYRGPYCRNGSRHQTCSRLRARRVFPVYTSRRCCSREARKSSGGRRSSTSTRRGSDALERPTLIPPTRPPT